jgi:hypothetical protein
MMGNDNDFFRIVINEFVTIWNDAEVSYFHIELTHG